VILLVVACGRSRRKSDGNAGSGSGWDDPNGGAGSPSNGAGTGALASGGVGASGDTGGESAGGDSGGAAGASDELGEEECSLEPITSDSAYTWDVGVVTLEVVLTLNGERFPAAPTDAPRGRVYLRNKRSIGAHSLDVDASGEAHARGLVFTGHYDAVLVPTDTLIVPGIEWQNERRLATDLAISEDTRLEIDLRTVSVTGAATVNGETMPDSPNAATRGRIHFYDPETGSGHSFDVGATGEARFGGALFAGTYDVLFETSNETLAELPYAARTRLAEGVVIDRDRDLSYDLKPVDVDVTVTGWGATLPDAFDVFRGYLSFLDRATYTAYRFDLGASGAASFAGRLFAGSYEVTFTGGSELPEPFPDAGLTRLSAAEAITGGEALRYDLEPVAVGGAVTLNGGRMPDNPDALPRGSVRFRDRTTGKAYEFGVGASGDGLYAGSVYAGNYDVSFDTNLVHQPGFPFGGVHRLESAVEIRADGVRDYDLRVVRVGGAVTSHGATLPDSAQGSSRGKVSFRDLVTGSVHGFDIGAAGQATFSDLLFAGSYDVTFDTSADPPPGLPPGASTRVAGNAVFADDQILAYDVRPVHIEGDVTINGETMPDSPGATTRGIVALRDKFTNVTHELDLGATGPGTFAADVFEGSFDAALQTANDELVGLPAGATALIATGCLDLGACEASTGDLGGHWTFVFDIGGFGPLTVDLEDAGEKLAGAFFTPTDSGVFEDGSRDGNAFTLVADLGLNSCSPLTLHATLFSACGVSGYATCGGISSYNPHFTGFR
jgi:hypothetical protein